MMRRYLFLLVALLLLAPDQVPAAPANTPTKKVEIFVTGWCGYCKKLEAFLKKNHIVYTRYNVEEDAKGAEIFREIGGEGVPVVRIGKEVIYGYDPDAILAALR